eukprot:CAMPEP_0170593360 /NCGR_PEP_ID=MMETSP0224-20130122/13406_1 /TAXON_ID=285029 /ORGANISM="Togula jolla, Strain CCCM 725" /LENGTH=401 /DNA_ID=CAMNT_0010917307 /DNA_START=48 /DNA_END=1253 /DNA_ORIENTATION=+
MANTRSALHYGACSVPDEFKGTSMFSEPMKVFISGAEGPRTSIFTEARPPLEGRQLFQRGSLEPRMSNFLEKNIRSSVQNGQAQFLENMRLMLQNEQLRLDTQQRLCTGRVAIQGRPDCHLMPSTGARRSGMQGVTGFQRNNSAWRPPRAADPFDEESARLASLLKSCEAKVARKEDYAEAHPVPYAPVYQAPNYNYEYALRLQEVASEPGTPRPACQLERRSAALSCDSVSTAVVNNPDAFSSTSDGSEGALGHTTTTVMMRNIPNNYTRDMLLDLLNGEGFLGAYDLVYLPMDFQTEVGLGYAFVNLVSYDAAVQLQEHFQAFSSWIVQSDKVCHMSWSDTHQGLQAHIDRYLNSPVMHKSVPDQFKPALFSKGVRICFPEPSKNIRPPRLRKFPAKNS